MNRTLYFFGGGASAARANEGRRKRSASHRRQSRMGESSSDGKATIHHRDLPAVFSGWANGPRAASCHAGAVGPPAKRGLIALRVERLGKLLQVKEPSGKRWHETARDPRRRLVSQRHT